MHSAVLHLRGDHVTPQPVLDSDANVLCWNGEVFGMDGDISADREEEDKVLMHGSDTLSSRRSCRLQGESCRK